MEGLYLIHTREFISTNKEIYGWHVILKQQGYQSAHIHPSGWLSGVIYIKKTKKKGISE